MDRTSGGHGHQARHRVHHGRDLRDSAPRIVRLAVTASCSRLRLRPPRERVPMRITFWGTRGSLPKPGPTTARYGGNTSCVEVSANGTIIVLDCGTGGHGLGQDLLSRTSAPSRGHLLISHTHWDHIQGIPFFAPLFSPSWEWDIYGPQGLWQGLRETL